MNIYSSPMDFSPSDQRLIAFMLIAAPRLTFKNPEREDGFISRMHKGLYIYRERGIKRKQYPSGRWYFEVESISKKFADYHKVEIDIKEGQHLCPCHDGAYNGWCGHIAAALLMLTDEIVSAWANPPEEAIA